MSMDYVDEKPAEVAPPVPLRTSPRVVKRKSPNSSATAYQQSIGKDIFIFIGTFTAEIINFSCFHVALL